MNSLVSEIAERLKEALANIWGSEGFQPLVETIESYFPQLKKSGLGIYVDINVTAMKVGASVSAREAPNKHSRYRLPLAQIATIIGSGGAGKGMSELVERLESNPELKGTDAINALEAWKKGLNDAHYQVMFGKDAALPDCKVEECRHCGGRGYTIEQ